MFIFWKIWCAFVLLPFEICPLALLPMIYQSFWKWTLWKNSWPKLPDKYLMEFIYTEELVQNQSGENRSTNLIEKIIFLHQKSRKLFHMAVSEILGHLWIIWNYIVSCILSISLTKFGYLYPKTLVFSMLLFNFNMCIQF